LAAGLPVHIDDLFAPAGENIVQVIPRSVELLGADDQIDIGQAIDQFLSPALGHATQETQHPLRAGCDAVRPPDLHFADGFLFRASRTLHVLSRMTSAAPSDGARV